MIKVEVTSKGLAKDSTEKPAKVADKSLDLCSKVWKNQLELLIRV